MHVIVTVPHSMCAGAPPGVRVCDTNARRAAAHLIAALRARLPADVPLHALVNQEVYRSDRDLNRAAGRDAGFRPELRRLLAELGARAVLIDVHSYPHGSFGTDDELVFLEPRPRATESAHILAALREAGVAAGFVRGHPTQNDIEREAREHGAHAALLLEVCEEYTELERAMAVVADGLLTIVNTL